MTFFGAVFLFPAVLALSSLGAGLLVDRISGSWLPAPAIPVVGFAALVGIGQITTSSAAVAPVTAGAFVFAAAGGYVLSISRLRNLLGSLRRSPWVLFSCIIAYGIAIAPVLLAGRTSLAFYLTDTTTGTHLAGADWLIANGRNFGDLPLDSSYGLQLRAYFEASNYPSGGHVVLAALGQLIPVRLTWLYQPYMATALALLAPSAYVLLGKAGMRSAPAALGAVLVSVPALVYALDLTGSIKELTALSQIMLLGVLVSEHRRWLHLAPGAGIPLGIAVGAGLSAIGAPFAAWGFAAAAAVLPAAISRVGSRTWPWWRALALGGTIIAAAAVMAPAVVSNISQSTATANGIATTTDPGNLLQPLDPLQAFGIWITGQYRFPPGE
ncbi:MAG: hypothetical protein JWO90_1550, partial [Solirubrobacterales bacterium]|nr:hypothetical protein [Solirubrobacterales bacterium]